MDSKKIERLKNHILALENSYKNIIEILNEDAERDKENQKIKIKDSQKKVFAEGIQKSSETANFLLQEISSKEDELEKLKNPEGHKKEKAQKQEETNSDLNGRLK